MAFSVEGFWNSRLGLLSVRISLKVFTSCEMCAHAVECLSRGGHTLLVYAEV